MANSFKEVFSAADFTGPLEETATHLAVERVVFNREDQRLKITVTAPDPVPGEVIGELEAKLSRELFAPKTVKVSIFCRARQQEPAGPDRAGPERGGKPENRAVSPASSGRDSGYIRKPKDPSLFYGRNTDGEIIPIRELEETDGEVVIRGQILSYGETALKREDRLIVSISLTDFTDTVTAKLFLSKDQAKVLAPHLAEGNFIKLKGAVTYDTYANERAVTSVSGIASIPDFREKRKDTSGKKRVELHCHTKASEMDGVSGAAEIVRTAYEWGMPAVAITDHGVAYALPAANHAREDLWNSWKKKCGADGKDPGKYEDFFKVIYGIEGYLVNDIEDREPDLAIQKKKTYHIILLAQNETGRVNLYRLISKSHLEYYARRPRIPKSELLKYREGIIIGSACEAGEIFRAIVRKDPWEEIRNLAGMYDYLEIQPVGNNRFMIRDDENYPDIQTETDLENLNREVIRLGEELGKPVVATCDVHFLNPEDEIYRRIIMSSKGFEDADEQAPLFLRTTEEMLKEFSYLGREKAEEVVIANPNRIAGMIEAISPVRPDNCPPVIENSDVTLREICEKRAHELYGETLPKIVEDRMNVELDAIIGHGYAVLYIIAQKLVWKSREDGYLVGSRGSVGSSFVAFLAGITEVNSLAPHYRCPSCRYSDFDSEEVKVYAGGSGCDMPERKCPVCGADLVRDGFDIPFETFLGFGGGKEPDIDLNFSGEYQLRAHQYTEEIFGKGQTFKAGVMSGVNENTAYGMVKGYFEDRGIHKRRCEIERIMAGCIGVRKGTGQHPGGIVVLPKGEDINTFTPIQHPANDMNSPIVTTHFEYHSIDHNLLKLDELGHDDPTMIRELGDLTGLDMTKIPLHDEKVMSLFTSTKALGLEPSDLFGWRVGSLGIPEFGTDFVVGMLIEAAPKKFSDLIRIAGLGHGTAVWLDNAQDLIRNGTCTISDAICCRDDIMVYLIQKGLAPETAFKIMEAVRKGKVAGGKCDKWEQWKEEMLSHGVPEWYVGSCEKIRYMFPKAHAAAYVMMAWRIAYCKLYYPLEYYAAYYSIRADAFSYETMCQGRETLEKKMRELVSKEKRTDKEKGTLKDMRSVQEMYARGFAFTPIDLYRAKAKRFLITDGKIMPSFASIPGLGEKAAQSIEEAAASVREADGRFTSVEQLKDLAQIGDSTVALLKKYGILGTMQETEQMSLFDFNIT